MAASYACALGAGGTPLPADGAGTPLPVSTPLAKRSAEESGLTPPNLPAKSQRGSTSGPPTLRKVDLTSDKFFLGFDEKKVVEKMNTALLDVTNDLQSLVSKIDDGPVKLAFESVCKIISTQFDILELFVKKNSKTNKEKMKQIDHETQEKIRTELKSDLVQASYDVKVGPVTIDFGSNENFTQQARKEISNISKEIEETIKNRKIIVLANKKITQAKKKDTCFVLVKCENLDNKKKLMELIKDKNLNLEYRYNFPSSVYPIVKKLRSVMTGLDRPINVKDKVILLSDTTKYNVLIRPTSECGALRISYGEKGSNDWNKIVDFQLPNTKSIDQISIHSIHGLKYED